MIHLIGAEGIEGKITQVGLTEFCRRHPDTLPPDDVYIYGGSEFAPGRAFDLLLQHSKAGDLLGVHSLWITEDSLSYDAPTRAAIGALLQRAVPAGERWVCDDMSVEWSEHFNFKAKIAGHLAWLCPRDMAENIFAAGFGGEDSAAIEDVGLAFAVAIMGSSCVLHAVSRWGWNHNVNYHGLVRWARRWGLATWLAKAEVLPSLPQPVLAVYRDQVEDEVLKMLERFKAKCEARQSPDGVLTEALGVKGVQVGGSEPRELVLGEIFDPATHYTPEYFGASSGGLRYTRPDGTKDIYHGPAHDWEGFHISAQILLKLWHDGRRRRLLDLGCGSGSFVKHARLAGFDAYGVDISEAAVAAAPAEIREHLRIHDLTKPLLLGTPAECPHGWWAQYDLITALDFWEHIFEPEVDDLIEGMLALLAPRGVGFFIICTRAVSEPDWTIARGDVFTKENSWLLCSGHVTIRRFGWWLKKFAAHGLVPRWDLAYGFQVYREEDPGLAGVDSWRCKNLLVVERG